MVCLQRWMTQVVLSAVMLTLAPMAWGQAKQPAPPPAPKMSPPAMAAPPAAPKQAAPAAQAAAPAPTRQRVIIEEPIRVYDPLFDYPYPYAYAPDYMAQNFGYVKIESKRKDASVYVDGGFADKLDKAKNFALRPGTHDIELRDSDGREIFHQRVAVLVGKTTKLHAG